MLNRNQSKKNKIWKYAVILPVLIAFVIFFQVKVIAQEKNKKNSVAIENTQVSIVIVTKNSSNEELAEDSKRIKKYADIDLKFSRIKRNGKGEITAISASFNDNKGSKGQHKVDGDEPIAPFEFIAKKFNNGQKEIGFIDTLDKYDISNDDIVLAPMEEIAEMTEITEIPEMPELEELDEIAESSYEINSNLPSPPSPPSPPSMKNMPAPPSPPNFPEVPYVKVPTNPSDRKAWAKYEAAMDKFAQDWENGPEMKKFQSQMDAYEKKMEKYQPDMSAFEKEMKKYEAKMEKYHHQMKAYHDAHREKTQEIQSRNQARTEAQREAMEARIEAQRDAIEARTEAQREAIEARIEAQREAIEARREAMEARREAMEARREAIEAKKEAEKKSGNPKDN